MKLFKKDTIGIVSFFAIFVFWLNLGGLISVSAERIEVTSDRVPINPAVHWWQLDDGSFRAKNFNGEIIPVSLEIGTKVPDLQGKRYSID